MSRSIDLFIESIQTAEETAEQIGQLTGFTLSAGGEPGTWSLEEGGIGVEFAANHYIDDGDLLLGRYGYVLSARVPSDVRLSDAPETSLLRTVSEALHKGGLTTLLVHDLQYHDRASSQPAAPDQNVPAPEGTPA